MDPLDAKMRCLEISRDTLADSDGAYTLADVLDGASTLWRWAAEGLYSITEDDEEVTRQ